MVVWVILVVNLFMVYSLFVFLWCDLIVFGWVCFKRVVVMVFLIMLFDMMMKLMFVVLRLFMCVWSVFFLVCLFSVIGRYDGMVLVVVMKWVWWLVMKMMWDFEDMSGMVVLSIFS